MDTTTDAGSVSYAGNAIVVPSEVVAQGTGSPSIRVFMVGSIKIKDLAASGANALAIVSNGDIAIDGRFDASANNAATPSGGAGPGAITSAVGCAGGNSSGLQGGGGAGRAEQGKTGGAASGLGTSGGNALPSTSSGSPLLGGCRGGSTNTPQGGVAGGGFAGGAVQLTSRTTIRLSGATIDVSGAGGAPGGFSTFNMNQFGYGAAGGGSAGMVVLEAPGVTMDANTVIAAKGGGGGGRLDMKGADGTGDGSTAGAPGGVCSSCSTPDASNGITLAWDDVGKTLTTSPDSGHGSCSVGPCPAGGGAAGFLVIRNNNSGIVVLNGAAVRASYPTNTNLATRNRTKP